MGLVITGGAFQLISSPLGPSRAVATVKTTWNRNPFQSLSSEHVGMTNVQEFTVFDLATGAVIPVGPGSGRSQSSGDGSGVVDILMEIGEGTQDSLKLNAHA